VAGSCKRDYEISGSVKGGELSDYLRNYWLLEEGMCSKESVAMLLMMPFNVCVCQ